MERYKFQLCLRKSSHYLAYHPGLSSIFGKVFPYTLANPFRVTFQTRNYAFPIQVFALGSRIVYFFPLHMSHGLACRYSNSASFTKPRHPTTTRPYRQYCRSEDETADGTGPLRSGKPKAVDFNSRTT